MTFASTRLARASGLASWMLACIRRASLSGMSENRSPLLQTRLQEGETEARNPNRSPLSVSLDLLPFEPQHVIQSEPMGIGS